MAATTATIKPTDLRGILKYVPRFQGQIFVLALDGSIVADDNFGNLLVDIAVLRSLGIKVVLVHGIGQQIQELSVLRGVPITNNDGTGVTDAATLDLAIRASARVSHLVLEGLTQNSLKAALTNAVRALPVGIIKGVDQQLTGKVERVDRDFITHILDEGIVPIIQPIGFGPDGKSLRINSDLLAAELAEALLATKIIYLTPAPGMEIDGEIRRATRRDVRALYSLIRGGVKREELIHRTQQAIEKNIDQFYVFEIDENIIACVTLYFYPGHPTMAELGTLYVLPFYHNRGIGRKMVEYASLRAKEKGATTLVALSTQNFGFFTGVAGFEEADKSVLPEARLKTYEESGRNPRVLIKTLETVAAVPSTPAT